MKKLILSVMAIAMFASCSSNEKTAREKIEDYISKNANDPSSYEFIEMEKPDTTFMSGLIELDLYVDSIELESELESLESCKTQLAYYSEQVKGEFGYIYQSSYDDYKNELPTITNKVDSIKNLIKTKRENLSKLKGGKLDKVFDIEYTCNFRIKNALGALIKTSATITYENDDKLSEDKRWGAVELKKP